LTSRGHVHAVIEFPNEKIAHEVVDSSAKNPILVNGEEVGVAIFARNTSKQLKRRKGKSNKKENSKIKK